LATLLCGILAAGAPAFVASGCASGPVGKDRRGQVDGTAFEFSSNGTSLTDENGSWTVRVRGDAMWIAQFKNGKTREFGTFQLSGGESSKLWGFIEEARLAKRPEGSDVGNEAPSYSFTLLRPKKLSHTTNVSSRAAASDPRLDDLVSYVQKLVRKYTHKKAVIWPPDE
jgi:hypothetical protein